MSEYQYYEFQAIDRPLTNVEIDELRKCSSRARITPTSFVNEYSWGNFRGDRDRWIEKYFDASLYLANWGSRELMLRLPAHLMPMNIASHYVAGDSLTIRAQSGRMVIAFGAQEVDTGEWVEGNGWLASLVPIRTQLIRGDYRALYIGWLLGVQNGDIDDEPEPPVPPNMGALSASLQSLANFLGIDQDLIEVAAQSSESVADSSMTSKDAYAWVAELAEEEKNQMLTRILIGDALRFRDEMIRAFEQSRRPAQEISSKNATARRTAAWLLDAAHRHAREREASAAQKAEEAKLRREHEAGEKRRIYLNSLTGKEEKLWTEVEQRIATKAPKEYDAAIERLIDLRDLAMRKSGSADFSQRTDVLRVKHLRKPAFMQRLKAAGLCQAKETNIKHPRTRQP